MNNSPLIYSCTLLASLSLLNIGSAWSASDLQEMPKATLAANAKPAQAKALKIKAKAKIKKESTAKKIAPSKLASADSLNRVPAAAASVTTNPYLVSQPVAILPKSANPYSVASGIAVSTATAAPVSTPVASTVPAQPTAAPVVSTPSAAQSVAAATTTARQAPVATAQPVNNAPSPANPYAVAQQPNVLPDLAMLFSQFGNGLKTFWPVPQQTNYAAPMMVANPAQGSFADATNSFNQIFTSLKMALPAFPQPVVTPTQTAIADTSNSFNQIFSGLKGMLPSLPSGDTTLLPVIKTVYPTGEKPLVILNFKCPTEMIGITPPPMKLLHEAINFGFDGVNKTNLLSFNLQQVCS
jgi:hypothetical protein